MKFVANYSGGKDSTAMILKLWEHNEPIDAIVFFDFGMEYPQIYQDIEHMKQLAKEHNTPFLTARPEHTFEWFCVDKPLKPTTKKRVRPTGYAFPNMKSRWCTAQKRDAIKRTLESNGFVRKETIHYVGIAADEPKRIHADDPFKRYPLNEYGITESQCLGISMENGFFLGDDHPYRFQKRVSCYCCQNSTMDAVRTLVKRYPQLWANIKRIEKRLFDITDEAHGGGEKWRWRTIEHRSTDDIERIINEKEEKEKRQLKLFDKGNEK